MRRSNMFALAMFLAAAQAGAQVPADQLARPPPGAEHFTIMSPAGKHGSVDYWTAPDGRLMGRMSLVLRGQVWEEDEAIRLGADGAIADYELRGSSPSGDVGESFHVADGIARWKSQIDAGSAPYRAAAFYLPAGFAIRAGDLPLERVIAHPGEEAALLPGGRARLTRLISMAVGQGPMRRTVTAWAVTGISGTPYAIWADEKGHMFAQIGGL